MKHRYINYSLSVIMASAALILANFQATAADLTGNVQGAGQLIAGSTVTLFAAGTGAPAQLAQSNTDSNGAFNLTYDDAPADSTLYVICQGRYAEGSGEQRP